MKVCLDKAISLSGILTKFSDEIVSKITRDIRSLMISLYPFDIEMTQPPTKCSAEATDREIVLQALVQLMESTSTTYCNEPRIHSREGFNVVHGELDLLLGDNTDSGSGHVILLSEDGGKESIVDPEISETKSATGRRLAAKRLSKKSICESDLSYTIQPVLQLLFMGQLQTSSGRSHFNCFYMNRHKVRPYVYFPSDDIMLTTRRAYVWQAEDRLMLRGCLLISILLRLQSLKRISSDFWSTHGIPSTNFLAASNKVNCKITDSIYLKATSKQMQGKPLMEQSHAEQLDFEGKALAGRLVPPRHLV